EAVQESNGEFRLLQPVVIRGLAEGRDRECEQHNQAAKAKRRALGEWLDQQPASPASDMEAVHEGGESLEVFAQPAGGMEYRRIENRVEVEQGSLELDQEIRAGAVRQARFLRAFGPFGHTLVPPRPNCGRRLS